jgi:hypothetical protein
MPQKVWVVGEEVLAADFNLYVQQQVVASFPTTAARDAWSSPPEGVLAVTTDTNALWQRRSGAWKGLPVGVTARKTDVAAFESGEIGTTASAVNDLVVPAFVAGRTYRIHGSIGLVVRVGTAGSSVAMTLRTGPTTGGETTLAIDTFDLRLSNVGYTGRMLFDYLPATTVTGHRVALYAGQTAGGAATIRFFQGAGFPFQMTVNDLGVV